MFNDQIVELGALPLPELVLACKWPGTYGLRVLAGDLRAIARRGCYSGFVCTTSASPTAPDRPVSRVCSILQPRSMPDGAPAGLCLATMLALMVAANIVVQATGQSPKAVAPGGLHPASPQPRPSTEGMYWRLKWEQGFRAAEHIGRARLACMERKSCSCLADPCTRPLHLAIAPCGTS